MTIPMPFEFYYTNWRGETALRRVLPLKVFYGVTEWHEKPQWFLEAWCLDRNEIRQFAMADMLPPHGHRAREAVTETNAILGVFFTGDGKNSGCGPSMVRTLKQIAEEGLK